MVEYKINVEKDRKMNSKKLAWIVLVICVILLSVCLWSYFKYTYHERDESYIFLNGIYLKCTPIGSSIECSVPGEKIDRKSVV